MKRWSRQATGLAVRFRTTKAGGCRPHQQIEGLYAHVEAQAAWQKVLEAMRKSGASPLVDHVFPFDQLPQAFERLRQGPLGKVLLRVGS